MSGPVTACPRCGIKREARPSAVVCRDCKSVMTPAEYELWKDGSGRGLTNVELFVSVASELRYARELTGRRAA